jgi:hypothetical protein
MTQLCRPYARPVQEFENNQDSAKPFSLDFGPHPYYLYFLLVPLVNYLSLPVNFFAPD